MIRLCLSATVVTISHARPVRSHDSWATDASIPSPASHTDSHIHWLTILPASHHRLLLACFCFATYEKLIFATKWKSATFVVLIQLGCKVNEYFASLPVHTYTFPLISRLSMLSLNLFSSSWSFIMVSMADAVRSGHSFSTCVCFNVTRYA